MNAGESFLFVREFKNRPRGVGDVGSGGRRLMQTLKHKRFTIWQAGQRCKSDVKVLLHFRSAKLAILSRETRFLGVDDVRVLLQRKKFCGECGRWEGASEATRPIGKGVLHSRCNAASARSRAYAFFPSAAQVFLSGTFQDCNTEKLFLRVPTTGNFLGQDRRLQKPMHAATLQSGG